MNVEFHYVRSSSYHIGSNFQGRVQNNSRPLANFQQYLVISEYMEKYLAPFQSKLIQSFNPVTPINIIAKQLEIYPYVACYIVTCVHPKCTGVL